METKDRKIRRVRQFSRGLLPVFHGEKMKKGLTLVELSVAVIISGILVLTVGIAVSAAAKMMGDAARKTQLRRDSSYALMHIERQVRCKGQAQVTVTNAGPTSAKLTLDPGASYYEKQGANLVYVQGATTITLIQGSVTSLQFARPNTYLVSVSLVLTNGNATLSRDTTIMLRN